MVGIDINRGKLTAENLEKLEEGNQKAELEKKEADLVKIEERSENLRKNEKSENKKNKKKEKPKWAYTEKVQSLNNFKTFFSRS